MRNEQWAMRKENEKIVEAREREIGREIQKKLMAICG